MTKGLDANKDNFVGQILTMLSAPIMILAMTVAGKRINAIPDKGWEIPLDAPDLPKPFKPQAGRFGTFSDKFDQGHDAPGQWRAKQRARAPDDAYAGDRPLETKEGGGKREATDAALGDEASEASMRYEDHARLRMQARREGLVKKGDEHVVAEDNPESASAEYTAWRTKKIKTFLAKTVDTHATDHSTIMTNPMHAEKALAYDVAIGHCHIRDNDLHALRVAADWRFLQGLDDDDPNKVFNEYFLIGKFNELSLFDWAHAKNSEGRMPDKIVDERENPPLKPYSQQHPNHGGRA